MPQRLRIFVSSPSDVPDERLRAALIVDKLSQDYSRFFSIESYRLEHEAMLASAHCEAVVGRYCCKSLFSSLIMKFPGCRRDVEINMWGVTSSRDELTGDFGEGREAISIGVCDLSRRLVGKVVACILGLLQQNRPVSAAPVVCFGVRYVRSY
jgi:hypothetical protein